MNAQGGGPEEVGYGYIKVRWAGKKVVEMANLHGEGDDKPDAEETHEAWRTLNDLVWTTGLVVAIEGAKRTGKSTLIRNLEQLLTFENVHYEKGPGTGTGWASAKRCQTEDPVLRHRYLLYDLQNLSRRVYERTGLTVIDGMVDCAAACAWATVEDESTRMELINATYASRRPDLTFLLHIDSPADSFYSDENKNDDYGDPEVQRKTIEFYEKIVAEQHDDVVVIRVCEHTANSLLHTVFDVIIEYYESMSSQFLASDATEAEAEAAVATVPEVPDVIN